MTLWIDYHTDFYDFPIAGVGRYGTTYDSAIRVYFVQTNGGYISNDKFINSSNTGSIETYIVKLYSILSNNNTQENFVETETKKYIITLNSSEISIYEKYRCDIYILEPEIMQHLDNNHKLFQKYVGYHTDHNPTLYKNYNHNSADYASYIKYKSPQPSVKLNNKICNVGFDNIKWY